MFLLPDHNAMFIHIPKTGGTFVRSLIKGKTPFVRLPGKQRRYQKTHKLPIQTQIPDAYSDFFSFAFVRHPVAWYESLWRSSSKAQKDIARYRTPNDTFWDPRREVQQYLHKNFNMFIRQCITNTPAFVTRMYEWYLGPDNTEHVTFIGRQENLSHDLSEVFRRIKFPVTQSTVLAQPRVNVSSRQKIRWDEELKREICRLEYPTIRRFYKENPCATTTP